MSQRVRSQHDGLMRDCVSVQTHRATRSRLGFTLLDVLIVVVIVSVLLALLTPALSKAIEAARRVKCAANLNQIGLALSSYEKANDGNLPATYYAEEHVSQTPSRLQLANLGEMPSDWDALGRLVEGGYLNAPQLFYCPSHAGENPHDRFKSAWKSGNEEIVINYHYRWLSNTEKFVGNLNPGVTLVADGLRTVDDYNHRVGNNMLKADMHVEWFIDEEQRLVHHLPKSLDDSSQSAFSASSVMTALDFGRVPASRDDLEKLSPMINASAK